MNLELFLGTLGWSLTTLAAPAASTSPPNIASLGTLQVLHYNDLGPENNGTAAVFVHDRLSYSDARSHCAILGESLFPLADVAEVTRNEIGYELDYLANVHDIQSDDPIWVFSNMPNTCFAYSANSKKVFEAPCHLKYSALCTSSVSSTTDVYNSASSSTQISVKFDDYTLSGYHDARSFRFLGIPFANPPVGDLRFAPPVQYSGSKEIDATKVSKSCIQTISSFGTLENPAISEDCLYLNVYTPVLPGSAGQVKKPVAVYIYGGSFTSGSASMIDYDGGNFASRNDVLVVTLNYRIGALGFLCTGNLTTGSYGIMDQIMALEWVHKYIEAFGGDPSQVTIFGQSAGGQSVTALLSSSKAQGLFSAALVQSAPVDLPWFTREVYADLVAPQIATAVGCNETDNEASLLSCLRTVPASSYIGNSTAFDGAESKIGQALASDYLHVSTLLASIEPIMPMVDDSGNGVIDDQFYNLISQNRLPNRVPTFFTSVTDEAALYIDGYVPNLGASQQALDTAFQLGFTPELAKDMTASGAFKVNASDPDGVRNALADALTRSEWSCPQSYLLDLGVSTSFPKLYTAEIDQGHIQSNVGVPAICSPNTDYNASCHTSDVLLAWGNLDSKTKYVAPYYNNLDILHSQLLDDVFGSFFRTHDPNPDPDFLKGRGPAYAATNAVFGQGGYRIKMYNSGDQSVSLLGMPPSSIENPGVSAKCAVLRDFGFTFQRANLTI